MKIFLSWSGEFSLEVALAFQDWLPSVIHSLDPWVSSEDINKGERWGNQLATELETTLFGIICVDSTNFNSKWLNFEAGALSKSVDHSSVAPFLFNISPTDLKGPLTQFQCTRFEKQDIKKLIHSINNKLLDPVEKDRLNKTFDSCWTNFNDRLRKIEVKEINQTDSTLIENSIEPTLVDFMSIQSESSYPLLKGITDFEIGILILLTKCYEMSYSEFVHKNNLYNESDAPRRKIDYCISRLKELGYVELKKDEAKITDKGLDYLMYHQYI